MELFTVCNGISIDYEFNEGPVTPVNGYFALV